MGEDASIDEFVAATDDGTGDGGPATDRKAGGDDVTHDDGAGGETDEDSTDGDETPPPDLDDVAPTVTIYGWAPQKTACETCGASTNRRWRDDGAMVCRECKEW